MDVDNAVRMAAIIFFLLAITGMLMAAAEHSREQDALHLAFQNQEALAHCRDDKTYGENLMVDAANADKNMTGGVVG